MGDVIWHDGLVSPGARGRFGATVWFTGLSGSGKSTVAAEVERLLVDQGTAAYRLDGDNVRHGLNADLGFSADDRAENVRRLGHVAQLFNDAGVVALVPTISPYRIDRDRVRARHVAAGLAFVEVFVATPLATCEERDPKGLYARARAGELAGLTGVDAPYEAPAAPEVVLEPGDGSATDQAARVITVLAGVLPSPGSPMRTG